MNADPTTAQIWKNRVLFYVPLPIVTLVSIFKAVRDLTPGLATLVTLCSLLAAGSLLIFMAVSDSRPQPTLPAIKGGNFALYLLAWVLPTMIVFFEIISITTPFKVLGLFQSITTLGFAQLSCLNYLNKKK